MAVSQLPQLPDVHGNSTMGLQVEQTSAGMRCHSHDDRSHATAVADQLPQIHSARGDRMNTEQWALQTRDTRDTARAIRMAIGTEALTADRRAQIAHEGRPANMTMLEEKLKKRHRLEQSIRDKMAEQTKQMKDTISQVTRANQQLNRTCTKVWVALNVVEKRVEIRAGLPEQERVQDELQNALEDELNKVSEAHSVCSQWVKSGQEVQTSLDGALAEMIGNCLTLHLNRTDFPFQFLERMHNCDKSGLQFCKDLAKVVQQVEKVISSAQRKTSDVLKRRMPALQQMRDQLQDDLQDNEAAIGQAESRIAKWEKQIREYSSRPENQLQDDTGINFDEFWRTAELSFEQFRKVQAAIKGAAYTGHDGRKLDTIFARADKNGSGELDEDEFKAVLRRALKIPPKIVSDPEIAAFCDSLDKDRSGCISIQEICAFLKADMDIEVIKRQNASMKAMVEELHRVHDRLVQDSHRKREAWLTDRACLHVNGQKALELDRPGNLDKKEQPQGTPRRRKPLEPRMVDKVKLKLQKALKGHEVDVLFGQYDQEGAGTVQPKDFLRVLRDNLHIPQYSITDAEIFSLGGMLAVDGTGAVGISEFAAFVGSDSETSALSTTAGSNFSPVILG